jgi:hypothetical protein
VADREIILTVCIPTFERSPRLLKACQDMFKEIAEYNLENQVAVFVSDNNSQDTTVKTLDYLKQSALDLNIQFTFQVLDSNIGGSANVVSCVRKCESKYALLLSDDDNVYSGTLINIVKDLATYEPSVAIYNFDQGPFSKENPLYKTKEFFNERNSYIELKKLVKWYKLSGIVLNRMEMQYTDSVWSFFTGTFFSHVIMPIHLVKEKGKLLLSNYFFAYPDLDYREHIPFQPYVPEFLDKDLQRFQKIFSVSNKIMEPLFASVTRSSVLSRSLHRLYEFYSGKVQISRPVHKLMWKNVVDGLLFRKTLSSENLDLHVEPKDYFRLVRVLFFVVGARNLIRGKSRFFSESGY